MTTEKFLEFKGNKITLVNEDGNFYVALKPICSVLEIHWSNELARLKEHQIFSSVMLNISTTGADGKQYEMVCLPERYTYGWLLALNPKTIEFIEFQKKCYDVLYDYFHGTEMLVQQEISDMEKELEEIETTFNMKEFLRWKKIKKGIDNNRQILKTLRRAVSLQTKIAFAE